MNRRAVGAAVGFAVTFAGVSLPAAVPEGSDLVISSKAAFTAYDVSTTPETTIGSKSVAPFEVTYSAVKPGTRRIQIERTSDGSRSGIVTASVTPQAPTLSSPESGDITIGSTITYTAAGTASGFDANTTKIEFYDGATLRATASSAPWSQNYNTTGHAVVSANQTAKRYWQGLAPADVGTVDSDAVVANFVASSQNIATIAGALCQACWKASAVTLSGSDITAFTDLSGNDFDLTVSVVGATNLARSATNANFNNKPTANFVSGASNAEGQNVENTDLTRVAPATTGHRIFVVGRRTAFGPNNAVFAGSTSADSRFQLRNGGAAPNMSINNGATVSTVTSPIVGTPEGIIATFLGGTNTDTLRRNDTTGTAGTAGNNSSTGFSFGSNRLKTVFLDWEIAEIALVDVDPDGPTDAAIVADIIEYINSEYGLSLT